MSSGETEFRSPGIPSMSTKGLELAFKVVIPSKAICEVEVGLASGVMILRPGTFPLISCAASVVGVFTKLSDLIVEMELATSPFFCVPYPTTTTSSIFWVSSISMTSAVLLLSITISFCQVADVRNLQDGFWWNFQGVFPIDIRDCSDRSPFYDHVRTNDGFSVVVGYCTSDGPAFVGR